MPKLRKCLYCKSKWPQNHGIVTPTGFLCSMDHVFKYTAQLEEKRLKEEDRLRAKAIKEKQKQAHKAKREAKRTDIKWQHKVTQQAFNKMRVLEEIMWFKERGLVPTCISCGNELGKDQWACGHYKTRGGNHALRYDRWNTYLQHNHRCNKMMSGDIHGTSSTRGFRQGILDRFGEEEGQARLDHCEQEHHYTWHWRELEEMRKKCNKNIKNIK